MADFLVKKPILNLYIKKTQTDNEKQEFKYCNSESLKRNGCSKKLFPPIYDHWIFT